MVVLDVFTQQHNHGDGGCDFDVNVFILRILRIFE
jgi:hypothetical protein